MLFKGITAAIAMALGHLPNGDYSVEERIDGLEYSLEENKELFSTWCEYYQASCQSGDVFAEFVFKNVYDAVTENGESEDRYEDIFLRQVIAFGVKAFRIAERKHELSFTNDEVQWRIDQFIEAVKPDVRRQAKWIRLLYIEYYQGNIDARTVLELEAKAGLNITSKHLSVLLNRPKA